MASFVQVHTGKWRAQVFRLGVRDSASFDTREEVETWAGKMEAAILSGRYGEPIQLSSREFLDIYRRSVERARQRGIEYHLTRQEVEALFLASKGRCAVSGIAFSRHRPPNSTKRPWYPSLDRIESAKPYTRDNCRFVCVAVNIAMCEWGESILAQIARAIVLGEPVAVDGPEAAPYRFAPLDGPLTARQRSRRRTREKSRQMSATANPVI